MRERSGTLLYAIPAVATVAWLAGIAGSGQVERVADHWYAGAMMLLGGLLAGTAPDGGALVAFPLLTKIIDTPVPIARTFALSIQAVGMGVASLTILLAGRRIERRGYFLATGGGAVGLLVGLGLLSDPASAYWDFRVPVAYAKVTFTIALAALAATLVLLIRAQNRGHEACPRWTSRLVATVAASGLVGGLIASLTGAGVGVLLFLVLVALGGLHPRVGLATAILATASVSLLGLVVLGLLGGQLDVALGPAGEVVAIDGTALVPALSGVDADLLGLWLAAVPVVVWAAPLGAWVAHHLDERRLIGLLALLAVAEVTSTALLLGQVRSDPALGLYLTLGVVAAIAGMALARRHRGRLLGVPAPHDDGRPGSARESIRTRGRERV